MYKRQFFESDVMISSKCQREERLTILLFVQWSFLAFLLALKRQPQQV
jgi:hypothetical protein